MCRRLTRLCRGACNAFADCLCPLSFLEVTAGICSMFETHLKERTPGAKNITYDITELYKFMDSLSDLSALV